MFITLNYIEIITYLYNKRQYILLKCIQIDIQTTRIQDPETIIKILLTRTEKEIYIPEKIQHSKLNNPSCLPKHSFNNCPTSKNYKMCVRCTL